MKRIKNRNEENAQAVYNRVNRVISADKSLMSEECKAVALRDFTHIAKEYFDLQGVPQLEIVNQEGTYTVSLIFTADRVKSFFILK